MRAILLFVVLAWAGSAEAATITVCASGCTFNNSQLQNAINAANHGDEILLEAGMTYSQSGSFVLPQKSGSCSGDACYTTIRSGVTSTGTLIAESNYPATGVRITPAYAAYLAKITVVVNNDAAIRTARTNACTSPCLANYWRLRRLEIFPNLYGGLNMIEIGNYRDDEGDEANHQNTIAKIPSFHILDQLYIRGDEVSGQHRCLSVSSREFTLSNSYLRWCKTLQNDGQSVMICNTNGPGLLINNYIEASTEGTITCGLDPINRQVVTVSASPSPTTTVFAVSGVVDLALEQWICVYIGGICKQTQVTAIAGTTLTVSPALPSPPSVGAEVKWSVQVEGWTWRYNHYTRPMSMRDPIVATPTNVQATPFLTGGNLAAGTYYIRVTGLHVGNFYSLVQSTRSAEVTCTISSGTTGRCAVSWDAVANVTTTYAGEYRIYTGTAPDAQDRYFTVNAPGTTHNYIGGAGTSGGPPWVGNKWSVKNLFEWKSCINCLAKWNYFEHNWTAQQPGDPILLSVLNDAERNMSAVIRDSTFEYNWVDSANSFMNISTSSTTATPSGIMEDMFIRHNLGTNLGGAWGDWRNTIQLTGGAGDHIIGNIVGYRLTIDHNTLIADTGLSPLYFAYGSGAVQDFVADMTFTNNLQRSLNNQGIVSTLSPSESNSAPGTVGWESSTTGTRTYGSNISQGATPCTPTGTICPNEATFQAQFVNYGAGNFACASGQTCYNGATVGSTYPHIGADVATIFLGTDIALSGNNTGGPVDPPDPPGGTGAGRRRMHIKIR